MTPVPPTLPQGLCICLFILSLKAILFKPSLNLPPKAIFPLLFPPLHWTQSKVSGLGASLVVQWLRLCRGLSLVGKLRAHMPCSMANNNKVSGLFVCTHPRHCAVDWVKHWAQSLVLKREQSDLSINQSMYNDVKNWLIWKDPDAGKDWRQEEKGIREDKMVGWHPRLNGCEFEQAPGVGDGQGSLACCSPWGRKESDTSEWLNWTENLIN